jgi:hypothetical protein
MFRISEILSPRCEVTAMRGSRSLRDSMRGSRPDVIEVLAFLRSPRPTRWVPRRKAAVVIAVRSGLISLSEACDRYLLAVDEFTTWEAAFDDEGLAGLQLKRCGRRREGLTQQSRRPAKRSDPLLRPTRWMPTPLPDAPMIAMHPRESRS